MPGFLICGYKKRFALNRWIIYPTLLRSLYVKNTVSNPQKIVSSDAKMSSC